MAESESYGGERVQNMEKKTCASGTGHIVSKPPLEGANSVLRENTHIVSIVQDHLALS